MFFFPQEARDTITEEEVKKRMTSHSECRLDAIESIVEKLRSDAHYKALRQAMRTSR